MMESGRWRGPDGYQELADQWDVSPITIEADAKESSRMLRRAITDEDVREWADAHLADILDRARTIEDLSNARGAIKDRLQARGLLIEKHEQSLRLERCSDPELFAAALVEIAATPEGREAIKLKARQIEEKEGRS